MQNAMYVLGDDEPPIEWQVPWEWESWRAAVLGGREASEELLQRLYAERWEPEALQDAMVFHKAFKRPVQPRKYHRVKLDMEAVQKRIAKAIWLECAKLLVRSMEPDAREYVCGVSAQAEKAAGIEIVGIVHEEG